MVLISKRWCLSIRLNMTFRRYYSGESWANRSANNLKSRHAYRQYRDIILLVSDIFSRSFFASLFFCLLPVNQPLTNVVLWFPWPDIHTKPSIWLLNFTVETWEYVFQLSCLPSTNINTYIVYIYHLQLVENQLMYLSQNNKYVIPWCDPARFHCNCTKELQFFRFNI